MASLEPTPPAGPTGTLGLDELDGAADFVALLAAPARSVFAAEVAA